MHSQIAKRGALVLVVVVLVAIALVSFVTLKPMNSHPESVNIVMTTFTWGFNVTDIPNFQDGKIYYNNPTLTVYAGQLVTIQLKSLDITHGFAINEFNVYAFIPPGQIVTVSFVANQAGNFTYYCDVFCGIGHPFMHGILQVLS
ncbi:MAG TPA: hypothetical protein VE862_02780 [Candidatus Acidoferrum sp.]|nr:hypothetical protein [Candidatus Acidoferrum sp.]